MLTSGLSSILIALAPAPGKLPLILALDPAGRPELHDETDLGGEARRFEGLGYRIEPSNDRLLHATPPRKDGPCTP